MKRLTRITFYSLLLAALLLAALPAAAQTSHETCDDLPEALYETYTNLAGRLQSQFWTLTDFCTFIPGLWGDGDAVPPQVLSGGVQPDGIPPIDNPVYVALDELDDQNVPLVDWSPVIALEINGDARAYPLAVLTRHEIVNDVVGDVPVAVTFCPLCNSAIVFDRRVDGEVLRFGVSGFLRNSDLIMWDDRSMSWWQQLTGEGILGVHTGRLLDIVSSQVVGLGDFRQQFPDGLVLVGDAGRRGMSYGSNPYAGYDSSPQPFLFRGPMDDRLFPVERVLGVEIDGQAVAYPFSVLREVFVLHDVIGETPVVAFWLPGASSALGARIINEAEDTGQAALFSPLVDGQMLTFAADAAGRITDEQTGSTWNIFGMATDGELAGAQLTPFNAFPHFWFAWAAFYPDTLLYGE